MTALALSPNLMSAQELARSFSDRYPDREADEVASMAIATLGNAFLRVIAADMLAMQIEQVRRGDVRVIELAAVVRPDPATRRERAEARREATEQRRQAALARVVPATMNWTPELLCSTFKLNGVHIRWDEATAEEHESYASRRETQADGMYATALRHREAARVIREAGAANLREAIR